MRYENSEISDIPWEMWKNCVFKGSFLLFLSLTYLTPFGEFCTCYVLNTVPITMPRHSSINNLKHIYYSTGNKVQAPHPQLFSRYPRFNILLKPSKKPSHCHFTLLSLSQIFDRGTCVCHVPNISSVSDPDLTESGFNQVSRSGFGIGIREGKNEP
jgi:hypothetical protein